MQLFCTTFSTVYFIQPSNGLYIPEDFIKTEILNDFVLLTEHGMKNDILWDVMPYGSCKNQCFGGTYRLHHQGGKNQYARNNWPVTANIPSSPILFTLMMEAIHSSEMSVLKTATRHHNPEDDILQSHRRENLKSYTEHGMLQKL
jgi:hypothetical protein